MPVVTRIKLNPEQAVLQCTCITSDWADASDRSGGEMRYYHYPEDNNICWWGPWSNQGPGSNPKQMSYSYGNAARYAHSS